MTQDEIFMSRALQLASLGAGHVSPNPMVGAVIVSADGRIIGEGFHRKYGEAHAEVNAFASIAERDMPLLSEATVYVTLEPCSHWGKTPPCADLICGKGVKRVVIGSNDPNPLVAGKGIEKLRNAGIQVSEGCLEDECNRLNVRFFTAHTKHRPWILLKWARTASGALSNPDGSPLSISNPVTLSLMHAERALCDAILVGTNTIFSDNPTLTSRFWPGNSPRPVIFDSERWHGREKEFRLFQRDPVVLDPRKPLRENMNLLFRDYNVISLMVEGGRKILDSFMAEGLYDRIRIETQADTAKIP